MEEELQTKTKKDHQTDQKDVKGVPIERLHMLMEHRFSFHLTGTNFMSSQTVVASFIFPWIGRELAKEQEAASHGVHGAKVIFIPVPKSRGGRA